MLAADPTPLAFAPRAFRAPPPPPLLQVSSARLRGALARARRALGERVPPNVRLPSTPLHGKPLPPPLPQPVSAARAGIRLSRAQARTR
ncbi:MAG TPA: hypothetical protein VK447_15025 [Myxococcaceae bacterium]|nr:hypothetical protein [Myxococcaceae bacterium]